MQDAIFSSVTMNIASSQVAYRRRIGSVGRNPVFGIGTIGGLHLVVEARNGSFSTLGAGSHPALARHIAEKQTEGLKFDDMSKSATLDPSLFADLVPEYEELTAQLRAAR